MEGHSSEARHEERRAPHGYGIFHQGDREVGHVHFFGDSRSQLEARKRTAMAPAAPAMPPIAAEPPVPAEGRARKAPIRIRAAKGTGLGGSESRQLVRNELGECAAVKTTAQS